LRPERNLIKDKWNRIMKSFQFDKLKSRATPVSSLLAGILQRKYACGGRTDTPATPASCARQSD
jgi:hypothetical protein